MEDPDAGLALIKKHVAMLGEHFDSVQVFATRHSNDGEHTVAWEHGSGNWYARYGQIAGWHAKECGQLAERGRQNELADAEGEDD